jgi:hypothetical protein
MWLGPGAGEQRPKSHRQFGGALERPGDSLTCASLTGMASAQSNQPTPQRLAAIREQMSLLSDYL